MYNEAKNEIVGYCYQVLNVIALKKVTFTKDYILKKNRLLLSFLVLPDGLTLSGFYCTNNN
jgi:hypothetical protein